LNYKQKVIIIVVRTLSRKHIRIKNFTQTVSPNLSAAAVEDSEEEKTEIWEAVMNYKILKYLL
jgi:hypothetical protein